MSLVLIAGFVVLSLAGLGSEHPFKSEGYWAAPKSGRGPGVLVLHAWWGLNGDVRAFCDRLAGEGFVAHAPEVFDGKTATTREGAEALTKAAQGRDAEIKAQIGREAEALAKRSSGPGIGVVGFSFGAYYALDFSNDEPKRVRAAVVFYGTGEEDFSKSRASYLGHFAEGDEFEPKASVEGLEKALGKAGRPATIHTYPRVGHWFFEPSVQEAYDKAAADLVWERTVRFLHGALAAKES